MCSQNLTLPEVENAIEITCNCIEKLQDHFEKSALPRVAIIHNYIIPWAREAEDLWYKIKISQNDDLYDLPYYDFIIKFSQKKLEELGVKEEVSNDIP